MESPPLGTFIIAFESTMENGIPRTIAEGMDCII